MGTRQAPTPRCGAWPRLAVLVVFATVATNCHDTTATASAVDSLRNQPAAVRAGLVAGPGPQVHPDDASSPKATRRGRERIAPRLVERSFVQCADGSQQPVSSSGSGTELRAEYCAPPQPPAPIQLVSTARETWIFAKPDWDSRRVGYLRAGAVVRRSEQPAGYRECRVGWYWIEPEGYVCVGSRASLELDHPVAALSTTRPRFDGLPYQYVQSRYPTPPLYARLPSVAEQQRTEPARKYFLRKHRRRQKDPNYVAPPPADPIPDRLQQGQVLPGLAGQDRGSQQLVLGQARVRSGFALLANFEHQGRRFGLTTELALIPLDRTRLVRQTAFHGVRLSDEFALPVAFVRSKYANRYRPHQPSGQFAADGRLPWRKALALTGVSRRVRRHLYYEVVDGSWVRADRVVRIERFEKAPKWAKQGRKWVDVSILRQALVAYEGLRPVYVTLVSTGADGLKDHKESHATIQGTFLIHTKHVSVTMDGDEQGDEFDLRDVPFVQYFTEGYALHGTYWHEDFGRPRSHGCVNLAPIDAAWLFRWTTPVVPDGWHAALSLTKGTVVHIHP